EGGWVGPEVVVPETKVDLHEDGIGKAPAGNTTPHPRAVADAVGHHVPLEGYFRLCSSTRRCHSSFDTPAICANASSPSTPPVRSISAMASSHSSWLGSSGQFSAT